jgi:hypothetical protein
MECMLRHIGEYPFEVTRGTELVGLSYTCFADGRTADELEIESHGYRYVRNDCNEELMLLVVRDS